MWEQLIELCNEIYDLDKPTPDKLFPDIKLDKEERKEIEKKIKELKKLIEVLTKELDNLAVKKKNFPREASCIPVARQLFKKWEQILLKK